MPRTPIFVGLVGSFIIRWRAYRLERRTTRLLADLPDHLRKDIGWPEGARERGDPCSS